jgi:hypothetical protein
MMARGQNRLFRLMIPWPEKVAGPAGDLAPLWRALPSAKAPTMGTYFASNSLEHLVCFGECAHSHHTHTAHDEHSIHSAQPVAASVHGLEFGRRSISYVQESVVFW